VVIALPDAWEIQTDLVAVTQTDMDSKSQYSYRTAC
jgi:hypothetical protein